ncbi:MnuA family membrane nuclease [Mycoplasmopsis edwardii]|uniref:Nuclease n=1 Tax=Mycoplasmopsis edwardii TaxID=53558 RepID=A0ACD4PH76_9BACT|nr:nuclease [Mycoplasmopsis edwardii]WBP84001.1 nuclease [Mycoplasmopsis edwardii]
MARSKKSKLKWIIPPTTIVALAGAAYGAYTVYKSKSTNSNGSETNKQNTTNSQNVSNGNTNTTPTNNGSEVLLATWNIANFGKSTANKKLGFRIQGLAEIITKTDLKFISVQEVGEDDFSAIQKLVDTLNSKYNKTFAFAKSPKGLKSVSRPKSVESYAIIYDKNIFSQLDSKGYESFSGQDIELVRPFWTSYWSVNNSNTKFWIINGHLDSPGDNEKAGENNAGTIVGHNWIGQGEQEVREYLDIPNAIDYVKGFYGNNQIQDAIIFNGDTNIKKENFAFANKYVLDKNLETGYLNNINYQIDYITSLNTKGGYANPYDKFISYDPNNLVEPIEEGKYKFDLQAAFKTILDRETYRKLYTQDENKTLADATDANMAFKLSDHTFALTKLKIVK